MGISTTNQRHQQRFSKKSNISPPRLGTALPAFLRRYIADLRGFDPDHSDRIVQQMIDCADFLLIEGERLEGALHG